MFPENDGFEDMEFIAYQLSTVLGDTFNNVWNTKDVYDYTRFMSYKRFEDFRERVYNKRRNK